MQSLFLDKPIDGCSETEFFDSLVAQTIELLNIHRQTNNHYALTHKLISILMDKSHGYIELGKYIDGDEFTTLYEEAMQEEQPLAFFNRGEMCNNANKFFDDHSIPLSFCYTGSLSDPADTFFDLQYYMHEDHPVIQNYLAAKENNKKQFDAITAGIDLRSSESYHILDNPLFDNADMRKEFFSKINNELHAVKQTAKTKLLQNTGSIDGLVSVNFEIQKVHPTIQKIFSYVCSAYNTYVNDAGYAPLKEVIDTVHTNIITTAQQDQKEKNDEYDVDENLPWELNRFTMEEKQYISRPFVEYFIEKQFNRIFTHYGLPVAIDTEEQNGEIIMILDVVRYYG